MPIPSDTIAHKTFGQIESEASRMYREARKDIMSKINDFTRHYKAKDKEMQKGLKKGTVTQAQYQRWLKGQVFIGDQWKAKKASINATMANVMNEASAIVHDKSKEVFAENANYTAYQIEQDYSGAINFNLYDKTTVDMLLRDDPELLIRRTDADGNKLDAWNTKTIDNAISQGIIQGESINQISQRIARDLCIKADRSTLLYARTAMTCAQNAGRIERMKNAEEAGIKMLKVWISTMDERTRSAHQELDGQEVPVDQPFSSMLGPIDFPGDPGADEANVWNCRCALGYNYPEYRNQDIERTAYYEEGDPEYDPDHRNYEVVKNMTYEQWVNYKQDQIRQRYGGEVHPEKPSKKPVDNHAGDPMYDFSDLEQERKEQQRLEQIARDSWEEYKKLDQEANALRQERNRLTDLESTLGGLYEDYSRFYSMTEEQYIEAYKQKQDRVGELYTKLDAVERPRASDFRTDEEYYEALNKYHDQRAEIRKQLEQEEKELYKMPSRYKFIEEQREASTLGHEGIQAKRDEINQKLEELKKQKEEVLKRHEEDSQKAYTWNSAKLVDTAQKNGVEYSVPIKLEKPLSTDEIVARVGGGDMTKGSCASLGFCYAGQKEGYDVLDFRDGASRQLFASHCDDVLKGISKEIGKPLLTESTNTGTGGSVKLIKQCVPGKEYYFSCGRHAAIVRSDDNGRLEYMELQSRFQNGWKLLGYKDDRRSMDYTFSNRFGCGRSVSGTAYMMDIEDMKGSKLFHRTLGYINTAEDQQRKGATGHER